MRRPRAQQRPGAELGIAAPVASLQQATMAGAAPAAATCKAANLASCLTRLRNSFQENGRELAKTQGFPYNGPSSLG
jgi:hypothetical protein